MTDTTQFHTQDLTQVDRVEVIDDDGRSYVKYGVTSLECHLQDNGTTLKLFIRSEDQKKANQT